MSQSALKCQQCDGWMYKRTEAASQGMGCIVVILGLCLAVVVIGIPIIIWGLLMMCQRRGLWVCRQCGYQIPRALRWYEFG